MCSNVPPLANPRREWRLEAWQNCWLREFGIEVLSHVISVGNASIGDAEIPWERIAPLRDRDEVLLNCADADAELRMKEEVDRVLKTGDSVGGVFEVVAHNVPPGLGTYAQWDERLDALLAGAVMSLQAVKAVEIGSGITAAASLGSAVHDEIGYNESDRFCRIYSQPQQCRRNRRRRLERRGHSGARLP